MLEILYRIYQVDEKLKEQKYEDIYKLWGSESQLYSRELVMDVVICESRDQFKDIIRSQYGQDIKFRYSRKMKDGDVYCIIIGEHCWNSENYFNKRKFTCDYCGCEVETYLQNWDTGLSESTIKLQLYGNEKYKKMKFCGNRCMSMFLNEERKKVKPDDDSEFYVDREMLQVDNIIGYIYKITKKSTGKFYIGQTKYAPIFRWGQHLKTERFDIENILDYQFETIRVVHQGENINDIEKYYIQRYYKRNPDKSLNVALTNGLEQMTLDDMEE